MGLAITGEQGGHAKPSICSQGHAGQQASPASNPQACRKPAGLANSGPCIFRPE
ncbi:hypothetical protein LHK_02169 [Laribacter hongkongensis HLHK9]|uniref:Uncharacterized protein n=1 Tax=Laribacter hongkongensis (strain HLHK9) TaxID=557598 RepID=C1D9Q1_LARHH|nr:hypothetical protein LHK_02169 [Laribacter hongkongensis HLHK9]